MSLLTRCLLSCERACTIFRREEDGYDDLYSILWDGDFFWPCFNSLEECYNDIAQEITQGTIEGLVSR